MYDAHYGLRAKPFQLTPDPGFFFEGATHRAALAYLGFGLAQGEGFVVVTGEIGAGKTTLVAHLMETIDRGRLNLLHLASTQVEGDEVLRLIAQALGLNVEHLTKSQLLDRIEKTLRAIEGQGRRTLLIVDEAQGLAISALEELRMLSNLSSGGRALAQIVLLGQPEFRDRLASPQLEQLRQRVVAMHHLSAMGADEIEPYVRHRLERAGWAGRPHLVADSFPALFAASGGLPRKLNLLMARMLLHGAVEGLDAIDGAAVAAVAAEAGAETEAAEPAPGWRLTAQPSSFEAEDRIARLEAQLEEQEAALRSVLALLVDWIERDEPAIGRSNAA